MARRDALEADAVRRQHGARGLAVAWQDGDLSDPRTPTPTGCSSSTGSPKSRRRIYRKRDWNRPGSIDDFIGAFADWHFDWLDVPAFIRAADSVLEFPMVDQDPLPRWSFGRVTLLGDAAHPMVPRGSNGAGQAILDARALTTALLEHDNPVAALAAYEKQRLEATTRIVLTNRTNPPDAILREVFQRTRRPAVRRDRRCHQPRRACCAVRGLQADRRLFEGCVADLNRSGTSRD